VILRLFDRDELLNLGLYGVLDDLKFELRIRQFLLELCYLLPEFAILGMNTILIFIVCLQVMECFIKLQFKFCFFLEEVLGARFYQFFQLSSLIFKFISICLGCLQVFIELTKLCAAVTSRSFCQFELLK